MFVPRFGRSDSAPARARGGPPPAAKRGLHRNGGRRTHRVPDGRFCRESSGYAGRRSAGCSWGRDQHWFSSERLGHYQMLILTRRAGEAILIEGGVRIVVLGTDGGGVRLGIEAPASVGIVREEVVQRMTEEKVGSRETPVPESADLRAVSGGSGE